METTEGVANYFIERALIGACRDLSQMKLQKLVYYAQGWHLGLSGAPLFFEPVLAWRYGPVIQSLRQEFRSFGRQPIDRKARDIKWENGSFIEYEFGLSDSAVSVPFLSRIWDEYHRFSAIQLTNMTHEVGTPWYQVANHYNFQIPVGITIPNELMRDYFQTKAVKKSA